MGRAILYLYLYHKTLSWIPSYTSITHYTLHITYYVPTCHHMTFPRYIKALLFILRSTQDSLIIDHQRHHRPITQAHRISLLPLAAAAACFFSYLSLSYLSLSKSRVYTVHDVLHAACEQKKKKKLASNND
ncbi:hypothetical protein LINPERHAP1_LOCUS6932 [Linum perenne]